MNTSADNFSEQLSAMMDGELPEAETRFLLRRLEHDEELRATWQRMHVAASCLRQLPWIPARAAICIDVEEAGLAHVSAPAVRRPKMRWAIAASVAALAIALAPGMLKETKAPPTAVATVAATALDRTLPSPASADLVAMRAPSAATAARAAAPMPSSERDGDLVAQVPAVSAPSSPLPLSAQSPSDFPLVDTGDKRNWPRSDLIGAASDPALEAYLVRHNQMLASDGLGGFVPYVDVVSSDEPAGSATATSPSEDGGAVQQ